MLKSTVLRACLNALPNVWKRKLGFVLGAPDISWSLQQLRRFGFYPKHVVDVGAYRGQWASTCLEVFPHAKMVCIEPQEEPQDELRRLAHKYPNFRVIQTLVGAKPWQDVPFQEVGSGSSVLDSASAGVKCRSMTTIDALIEDGQCAPPELLKLDVQGYEIEVLEGWTKGFECCQVIQCELSLLSLVAGSPLLHEVVAYFQRRGFVLFDVDEIIRAPSDGAVWQIDAIFCRTDSPLRTNRAWLGTFVPNVKDMA